MPLKGSAVSGKFLNYPSEWLSSLQHEDVDSEAPRSALYRFLFSSQKAAHWGELEL